jgi:hypothetical protein
MRRAERVGELCLVGRGLPQRDTFVRAWHRNAPARQGLAVALEAAVRAGGDQPRTAPARQVGQPAPLARRKLRADHRHAAGQCQPGSEAGGRLAFEERGARVLRRSDLHRDRAGFARMSAANDERARLRECPRPRGSRRAQARRQRRCIDHADAHARRREPRRRVGKREDDRQRNREHRLGQRAAVGVELDETARPRHAAGQRGERRVVCEPFCQHGNQPDRGPGTADRRLQPREHPADHGIGLGSAGERDRQHLPGRELPGLGQRREPRVLRRRCLPPAPQPPREIERVAVGCRDGVTLGAQPPGFRRRRLAGGGGAARQRDQVQRRRGRESFHVHGARP